MKIIVPVSNVNEILTKELRYRHTFIWGLFIYRCIMENLEIQSELEKIVAGDATLFRAACPRCGEYNLQGTNDFYCKSCKIKYSRDKADKTRILCKSKRSAPTRKFRNNLVSKQKGRCIYCGREFGTYFYRNGKVKKLFACADHRIPYSFLQANPGHNFVMACQICNGFKSDKIFTTMEDCENHLNDKWNKELRAKSIEFIKKDPSDTINEPRLRLVEPPRGLKTQKRLWKIPKPVKPEKPSGIYRPLKTQIQAKHSLCQFAKIIEVNKGDLSRFLSGDKKHIGRPARKKIRQALISLGFLPEPPKREYVLCSLGYKHLKKKDYCGNCYECLKNEKDENGLPKEATRMIVCPECGNKRCPKATDHNLACTHSNETGQVGSRYE